MAEFISALRAVFGSTGRAAGDLNAADLVLRTPLPLSRRVGFVSVAGGSGTTSALASVASLLARRRTGMVLAADAGGGQSGLARRLLEPASGPPADKESAAADLAAEQARRQSARTAAEARQGLVRTSSGLHLLDLAGPGSRLPAMSTWAEQVGPIVRFFDLVFTDWGVRPPALDLEEVAASGHLLVVVSRAERAAATAAAEAIDALSRSANPPRFLLTLVDVGATSDRMAAGLQASLGVPVVVVPRERSRSHRLRSTSREFSAATRTAHIRLATAVMTEVIRSEAAGGRMSLGPSRSAGHQSPDRRDAAATERPRHDREMADR